MKNQDQTVEKMIMQAHYLEALEIESNAEISLSDMERQEFIDTITAGFVTTSKVGLTLFTNGLALFLDTFLAAAPTVTSAFFFVEWTA